MGRVQERGSEHTLMHDTGIMITVLTEHEGKRFIAASTLNAQRQEWHMYVSALYLCNYLVIPA